MLLGLVAAGLGVALLANGNERKRPEQLERVGDDELPQAGDLERELASLGLTPRGEPLRIEPPKPNPLEVIETTATEAPAPV